MKKLLLLSALMICRVSTAQTQQEWEDVPVNSYEWQIGNGLHAHSSSVTNLQVENFNAESAAKRANNQIDFLEATLMLNMRSDKPFSTSFNIENLSTYFSYAVYERNKNGKGKLKEKWYNRNIYWGIFVVFYGMDGKEVSNKVWFSAQKTNYGIEYDANINSRGWGKKIYSSNQNIYIEKGDDNSMKMYMGYDSSDNTIASWTNIAGIKQITVMVGAAAKVDVKNLSIRRKTMYGIVKPIIAKGDAFFENKQFADAVREYTNAINKGYTNAEVYLDRARANACREYYVVAIEDCTTALTHDPTNKTAYLIRGLCKLEREDESCVADLRNAGDEGIAILKEAGLYDYYPNQNNSTTPNRRIQQRTPTSQNQLRKNPNFKLE